MTSHTNHSQLYQSETFIIIDMCTPLRGCTCVHLLHLDQLQNCDTILAEKRDICAFAQTLKSAPYYSLHHSLYRLFRKKITECTKRPLFNHHTHSNQSKFHRFAKALLFLKAIIRDVCEKAVCLHISNSNVTVRHSKNQITKGSCYKLKSCQRSLEHTECKRIHRCS